MNNHRKRNIIILFVLGILMIAGASYIPSMLYQLINVDTDQYWDLRYAQLIPNIRMCGVVLSAWGIAMYMKSEH